jgi:hypothetical protein
MDKLGSVPLPSKESIHLPLLKVLSYAGSSLSTKEAIMVEAGLGVRKTSLWIPKLDEDYFSGLA